MSFKYNLGHCPDCKEGMFQGQRCNLAKAESKEERCERLHSGPHGGVVFFCQLSMATKNSKWTCTGQPVFTELTKTEKSNTYRLFFRQHTLEHRKEPDGIFSSIKGWNGSSEWGSALSKTLSRSRAEPGLELRPPDSSAQALWEDFHSRWPPGIGPCSLPKAPFPPRATEMELNL